MKLIVILAAIALEHFFGTLERLRNLHWIQAYADWLHGVFGRMRVWGGPIGVLITAALPILVIAAVLDYLDRTWLALLIVADLFVLLYCLGPRDLNLQIDAYLSGVATQDTGKTGEAFRAMTGTDSVPPAEARMQTVMEAICVAANERLFAVYFWFAVLGPIGALLFRLASELRAVSSARTLDFAEAAARLHAILNWIPARLFALGFALAGSLTHTFDAWQFHRTLDLEENENLLRVAGVGALLFDRGGQVLESEEEHQWIEEVRSLIGRNFCVWLSVFGVITIAGWVA